MFKGIVVGSFTGGGIVVGAVVVGFDVVGVVGFVVGGTFIIVVSGIVV